MSTTAPVNLDTYLAEVKARQHASWPNAIANAVNADKVRDIVENAMLTTVQNLGPEGTTKMLNDGLGSVGVLFK